MSTPESKKVDQTIIHSNGGIRKTLLTPYRRIGLSRNRKTPTNTSFVSPLETKDKPLIANPSPVDTHINDTINSKNLSTTPIRTERKKRFQSKDLKITCENNGNSNTKLISVKGEYSDIDKKITKEKHTKISKYKNKDIMDSENNDKTARNISNDKTSNSTSSKIIPLPANNESDIINKSKLRKSLLDNDEDLFPGFPSNPSSNENSQKEIADEVFEIKKRKRINIINSQSSDESHYKLNIKNSTMDGRENIPKIVIDKELIIKKRKRINIISSQSSDDSDNIEMSSINGKNSPSHIDLNKSNKLSKLNQNDNHNILDENKLVNHDKHEKENVKSNSQNINRDKIKSKPRLEKSVKRKLSLKKSTSHSDSFNDEEIFTSSPKEDNEDPFPNLQNVEVIEKIIQLERTIQNKEMQLQKLQQAKIYHNLHKVEDLNLETNTWKVGCQEGLRDLLKNLNQHTSMDMNALLTNLKVPSELFKYDAESDSFL